jgi:hypothetical protein
VNNIKIEEGMITIPFEEYKELLILKGRYEELKSKSIINTGITYRGPKDNNGITIAPYKVTCQGEERV